MMCGTTASCRSPTTSAQRQIARAPAQLVPADPTWPEQARRIVNRLKTACGHRALRVDHIGSTAVPDYRRQGRHRHPDHRRIPCGGRRTRRAVAVRGLPPHRAHHRRRRQEPDARSTVGHYDHASDPALWHKRIHASADPGRPTNVHIRVDGWPNQQFALLFVDWLAANPGVRDDYLAVKRAAESGADELCPLCPKPRSRGFSTPTGGRGSGPTPPAGGPRASGAPHCSAPFSGSALPGAGLTIWSCLGENVVVHVDLAVHVGRVGEVQHNPHAGLSRIGQHRVGLEHVAGHGRKTGRARLAAVGHEGGLATGRQRVDPAR